MDTKPAYLCLALALSAPRTLAAQHHFPPDSAVKEIVQRVIRTGGNVRIVVGMLEADGSRRVVTVGTAPHKGRTLFEIGSITKVFTGILLAEMVERGEVRLRQPVSELLPDSVRVPSLPGRQITLLDLATHSSGLPFMPTNFRPQDPENPYADHDAARLYEFLRSYELRRDIGAQFEYSNLGVGLLGHALSLRADTSYEAVVTMRILQPLGLSSTMITIPDSVRYRLAPGHDDEGNPVSNWDLDVLAGAGALRSTANDLLSFLAVNLSPPETLLGRAIQQSDVMHYRRGLLGGSGLGWVVRATRFGRPIVLKGGGTAGYTAFAAFDPERRIGVVVLSNRSGDVPLIGLHLLDSRVPLSTSRSNLPAALIAGAALALLIAALWWWAGRRRK